MCWEPLSPFAGFLFLSLVFYVPICISVSERNDLGVFVLDCIGPIVCFFFQINYHSLNSSNPWAQMFFLYLESFSFSYFQCLKIFLVSLVRLIPSVFVCVWHLWMGLIHFLISFLLFLCLSLLYKKTAVVSVNFVSTHFLKVFISSKVFWWNL